MQEELIEYVTCTHTLRSTTYCSLTFSVCVSVRLLLCNFVIVFRVRKERDEVLETYLDQPFDEYCITRKELLELLRRHHNTKIALEKEKEETQR